MFNNVAKLFINYSVVTAMPLTLEKQANKLKIESQNTREMSAKNTSCPWYTNTNDNATICLTSKILDCFIKFRMFTHEESLKQRTV